jgi:hypothetical protein
MKKRYTAVVLLLVVTQPLAAAPCLFTFPSLATCAGTNCSVVFSFVPEADVRVLSDQQHGQGQAINFGAQSALDLGDNGRINFGSTGGTEAVIPNGSLFANCQIFPAGFNSYTVEMSNGGWLDFSGNNRMEFNANSILILGSGSKVDGRLDIQSEGSVGLLSTAGNVTMPNIDIAAEQGISVSGSANITLGNLQNTDGTGSNLGISIHAGGDVVLGDIATDDEIEILTTGDITIDAIDAADSISLLINSPNGGTIRVGDSELSDNNGPVSVICSASEDCNDFQLDDGGGSGGSGDPCAPENIDPNKPNACGGGGGSGDTILIGLLLWAVWRQRRSS